MHIVWVLGSVLKGCIGASGGELVGGRVKCVLSAKRTLPGHMETAPGLPSSGPSFGEREGLGQAGEGIRFRLSGGVQRLGQECP